MLLRSGILVCTLCTVLSAFCAQLLAVSSAQDPQKSKLQVASFNIRWYGLGGSMEGDFSDEYRNKSLKAYLNLALADADIIAFQEIVDVDSFQKKVIGKTRDCVTYEHDYQKHQHVMICFKTKYVFERQPGERDYIIQDVTKGNARYRPAVYGMLKEKSGAPLAHLIAVHLKAFPNKTAERLSQVEVLAKRIKELDQSIPVILMGDFNTYTSPDNGRRSDDNVLMAPVFKKKKVDLRRVKNPVHKTYFTPKSDREFDQLWVSTSVKPAALEVGGPCQKVKKQGHYNDVDYYNENVSDHCAISLEMTLPGTR